MIAWGAMVLERRWRPPKKARAPGHLDVEVIDLRTLLPLDIDTIVAVGQEDRPRA